MQCSKIGLKYDINSYMSLQLHLRSCPANFFPPMNEAKKTMAMSGVDD